MRRKTGDEGRREIEGYERLSIILSSICFKIEGPEVWCGKSGELWLGEGSKKKNEKWVMKVGGER